MAVAFVKHIGTYQDKTTSSPTITIPTGGVPAGDLVLVRYTTDPSVAVTALTCSDSRGNTYTRTGSGTPANGSTIVFFYSKLTTALLAGDTISFNSNAEEKAISIEQFSGVDAVEDVALAAANDSGGVYSVSSTTASADALLVGVFGITGPTGDTFTGDAPDFVGLTRVGTSGAGAASNTTNNGAYKIVSSTGTYTFNGNGSIRGWQGVLLALKAAVPANPLDQSRTDALGLIDSHTVVLTSLRSQTDNLGLLDSASNAVPLSAEITDALGALDTRTQAATYALTVTDTLQILDSVSQVGALNDTRTDLVSSLDSQTVAATMARGPPDEALSLLDGTSKSIGTTVQRPLTSVGTF